MRKPSSITTIFAINNYKYSVNSYKVQTLQTSTSALIDTRGALFLWPLEPSPRQTLLILVDALVVLVNAIMATIEMP
jgi:hypothetical protein